MDEVAKAAATYRRDLAKTALAREALYAAIRRGLRDGRAQSDLAKVSGFTRETIRKLGLGQ